jgi:hypothetical protein
MGVGRLVFYANCFANLQSYVSSKALRLWQKETQGLSAFLLSLHCNNTHGELTNAFTQLLTLKESTLVRAGKIKARLLLESRD